MWARLTRRGVSVLEDKCTGSQTACLIMTYLNTRREILVHDMKRENSQNYKYSFTFTIGGGLEDFQRDFSRIIVHKNRDLTFIEGDLFEDQEIEDYLHHSSLVHYDYVFYH